MSRRMDMLVARKNGDKTHWSKIGVAFEGERGWQLVFDALPVPDEKGQVRAFLFPPKEREPQQRSTADALDDDVPWSR